MEAYHRDLDQYYAVDPKNSLLSLQLLDQMYVQQKVTEIQPAPQQLQPKTLTHNTQLYSTRKQANVTDHQWASQMEQNHNHQKQQNKLINNYEANNTIIFKPVTITENQSQNLESPKFQKGFSMTDQNCSDILRNLEQSNISRRTFKKSYEPAKERHLTSTPQEDLALLKQLKEEAFGNLNSFEQTEKIKQNFQLLFSRVYGIIQQIEQRNQRSKMLQSRGIPKKQLSLSTKVLSLSIRKQKEKSEKKISLITKTDYDYKRESSDIVPEENVTNGNYTERTRNSSMKKSRKISLLTLSRQLPSEGPHLNFGTDTARSNKSSRSKGLNLVSAEKKPKEQPKKPVKISLVQKKIVICPKQKNQILKTQKVEKKNSPFSLNNFFNSRRISGTKAF